MVSQFSTVFSSRILFWISSTLAVGVSMPGMGKDIGFHIFCIHSKRSFGNPDPTSAMMTSRVDRVATTAATLPRRLSERDTLTRDRSFDVAPPRRRFTQYLLEPLLLGHDFAGIGVFEVAQSAVVHLK